MKKAIVTGASSGIGLAITYRLLAMGFYVIGLSRTITNAQINHPNFQALQVDLSSTQAVEKVCQTYKNEKIFILINVAGFGVFAPHEEIARKTIQEMTQLNLITPMLLTNATLRSLKRDGGYIININSIEALRASKFSALYSATKAGLKAFGDALFEETRKTQLSITNINPDMTQSHFYDNLRFDVSENENEKLLATDIADAVEHILSMRKGAVISDYTIRSLQFGIKKKKM
jgi:hypothetical protein